MQKPAESFASLPPDVNRRKCFLINVAYVVVIGAVVLAVIRYALSALMPFVIAALIAAILRPLLRLLTEKLHLPKKATGIAITVFLYLFIALMGLILFDRALDAATSFLRTLPSLWNDLLKPALSGLGYLVTEKLAQMNVELDFSMDQFLNHLGTDITSFSTKLLGMASSVAFSLPSILISSIICIVSTLFMLFDWDKITDFIYLQLSSRNSAITHTFFNQSGSTVKQYVVSYGLILAITFTELSIGFTIIGFKSPILLALLISVFDILPVLGCGGILIPWTLISFLIGRTSNGIGLLLLYLVITVVRNSVEPRIVGKQVGLHPLVTLMAMVVGSSLMGGIGLFGFPITLAVINKMNKDGIIHIYIAVVVHIPFDSIKKESPAENRRFLFRF